MSDLVPFDWCLSKIRCKVFGLQTFVVTLYTFDESADLINAERYKQFLEQHMLPSRQLLFQRRRWLFQQDKFCMCPNTYNLLSGHCQTALNISARVRVLRIHDKLINK